jgi:hypothetical protein
MAHSFEIPFEGSAEAIIEKAKNTIAGASGTLNGSESTGEFTVPSPVGDVKGSYAVVGNLLTVTITEKPFIAPYSMIEDALRKYLS